VLKHELVTVKFKTEAVSNYCSSIKDLKNLISEAVENLKIQLITSTKKLQFDVNTISVKKFLDKEFFEIEILNKGSTKWYPKWKSKHFKALCVLYTVRDYETVLNKRKYKYALKLLKINGFITNDGKVTQKGKKHIKKILERGLRFFNLRDIKYKSEKVIYEEAWKKVNGA